MSNIMNIYELRYIKLKGESKQIALKALKARLTLRPWLQTLLGLPPRIRRDYAVDQKDLLWLTLPGAELHAHHARDAHHVNHAHQASHSLYRRSEKNLRVCKASHHANQVPFEVLVIHDWLSSDTKSFPQKW